MEDMFSREDDDMANAMTHTHPCPRCTDTYGCERSECASLGHVATPCHVCRYRYSRVPPLSLLRRIDAPETPTEELTGTEYREARFNVSRGYINRLFSTKVGRQADPEPQDLPLLPANSLTVNELNAFVGRKVTLGAD
jgi:hypothetical protein